MVNSTFGGGYRPGLQTITDPLGAQVEFLASEHYMVKQSGVTLDSAAVTADGNGNKIVKAGTVLFRHAATGKYGPAIQAGATGADAEAKGLLFAGDVNLRYGDLVVGLLIHGSVKEARVTGLTAALKTNLVTMGISFQ